MDLKEINEPLNNGNLHHDDFTPLQKDQVGGKNEIDFLEELHEKYSVSIYTRCMTLFNSEAVAKEAVPYILLQGYLSLAKIDVSNQKQLINQLTYELCLDFSQRVNTRNNFPVFSVPNSSFDNTIQEVFKQEILSIDPKELKEILSKMPIGDKAILLMKYQDDMSIEQIAEIVGLGLKETKVKLMNAQYIAIELKSNLLYLE